MHIYNNYEIIIKIYKNLQTYFNERKNVSIINESANKFNEVVTRKKNYKNSNEMYINAHD